MTTSRSVGDEPWATLYRSEVPIRTLWNVVNAGFSPMADRLITKQSGPTHPRAAGKHPPGILWNTALVEPIANLDGGELMNWHFAPYSDLLVTEHSDGELRVWDSRDGCLRVVIPSEEDRTVTDISPDGLWLITRSSKTPRIVKMWNTRSGIGFELPIDQFPDRDLANEWLNRPNDRTFRFSLKTPTELPRFNADGSKVVTAAGLQAVSCEISSPREAKAWVQSNIAMRWDNGYLRTASEEEMLNARIDYYTLACGPEDPRIVSLRFELVSHRCQKLINSGNLDEAAKVLRDAQAWITTSDAGLYQSVQQICTMISAEYFKRGEKAERCGKHQNAMASYKAAAQTDETNAEAYRSLAWLQTTFPAPYGHRGAEAVVNAQKACSLTEWKAPHCLAVLAAAYAKVGDFGEAVRYQEKAFDLLSDQERSRWQFNFERRLELYRSHRRYDKNYFWDIPTEYLVAWMRLDEHEGSITADSSGNANHGKLIGDATWKSGIIGGGLSLELRTRKTIDSEIIQL